MTEVLKMFQFLQQHRVAEMEIRGRRIKTGLDFQRNPGPGRFFELFDEFLAGDAVDDSPLNQGNLFIYRGHKADRILSCG